MTEPGNLLPGRGLRTRKMKLIPIPGIVQLFYVPVNIHQDFPGFSAGYATGSQLYLADGK
jgi:hypothetical protein